MGARAPGMPGHGAGTAMTAGGGARAVVACAPARTAAGAVRFVIVAARRTGSNLLCTMLDSHPDVLCHHELFNPGGIFYALPLRDSDFSLGTTAERAADPVSFLARVWDQGLGKRCVGFKMTRGQDPKVLDALFADAKVRVIVLRRANRIKAFVSELRAEAAKRWEVYDPAQLDPARPQVRVDLQVLDAYIAENEAFYAQIDAALARSGRAALRVTYERLFRDDEQRRILGFLGLAADGVLLTARSVKQNSCDLRDLIENYDALAHELVGTALAAELADRGL
jgi:LPS sulfotransferase NodH